MEGKDKPHCPFIKGESTKAVHAGQYVDPSTGAVIPPIYTSSTFEVFADQPYKYIYGRFGGPTRTVLEDAIAALEGGKFCIATSSGMGAVSIICHLIKPGEHIIGNDDLYGGTSVYLKEIAVVKEGIQLDCIDLRDLKAFEAAIKPNTKMVFCETPTNPTLRVLDLVGIAKICKAKKIIMVVDNTFCSPIMQKPLELGADIVMHSCTKYIGGHSDLIMGVVVTSNDELHKQMKAVSNLLGCCPGPFDCYLASRGLKTLPLRVHRSCETAMKLAEVLAKHPKVDVCIYPGLTSHPGHELMKAQAKGFGGIITMNIKGDTAKANLFYKSLSLFGHAVSLGGVESLVSIPAMITHKGVPADVRAKLGILEGTVRLSIGIEDFEDLRDDLLHALDAIQDLTFSLT
eukprot:TRINITY_DN1720_c0_g1_i4.p1 TRINITY_DN1720_c0_g1~~TRINITY_DN1720_c0_g1_i4.p1  ORF type:complete len:401 (+),score=78.94 TRINITY_DN1720_c0_g1_i4:77-1279(+)